MEAWHRIDAHTQSDGSIVALNQTNDDNDDGYPDGETAEWSITYKDRSQFDRCVGVSRVGISGIRVTVTLDGKEI
jgi:hypothetical protein